MGVVAGSFSRNTAVSSRLPLVSSIRMDWTAPIPDRGSTKANTADAPKKARAGLMSMTLISARHIRQAIKSKMLVAPIEPGMLPRKISMVLNLGIPPS